MSRPTSISQRPLTLTEELEKLEQSITLTLQEIDHNFSRAHRIVTTSILPVVEQYAESSRDVWEGAKFWKQFFEASANVSLSGYEETPEQDTMAEQTLTSEDDSANISQSQLTETASYETPSAERLDVNRRPDDIDLTSLSLSSHSTPRAALQERTPHDDTTVTSSIAHPSPYEPMQNHHLDSDTDEGRFDGEEDSYLPITPGKPSSSRAHQTTHRNHDEMDLLSSSPFVPPVSTAQKDQQEDPIMHRLLDKTYRVQATPLKKGYDRSKFTVTPKYAFDDSPISSPEPEAPQLNSELFSSPLKAQTPNTGRKRRPSSNRLRMTPKPGTSVLTPAKGGKRSDWDSDEDQFDDEDDDEDELGLSPPKTMQFHIPQSRLMKTPAKEASRRIVEQLLFTAGANDTTDDFDEEQSPSVIRRVGGLEDDTF